MLMSLVPLKIALPTVKGTSLTSRTCDEYNDGYSDEHSDEQ
jgi:hypothetical protein